MMIGMTLAKAGLVGMIMLVSPSVNMPSERDSYLGAKELVLVEGKPIELRYYDRDQDGRPDFITARNVKIKEKGVEPHKCPVGYLLDKDWDGRVTSDEFYINPNQDCTAKYIVPLDDYVQGHTAADFMEDEMLDWVWTLPYDKTPR